MSSNPNKYGRGTHPNCKKNQFKEGCIAWNKGKPYSNSGNGNPKTKWTSEFLRRNKEFTEKRTNSRLRHEIKVDNILQILREKGEKVYPLSQGISKERQPDLILIKNGKVIAIEIESEKRYKPSKETTRKRFNDAHLPQGFFDEVNVIWFREEEILNVKQK